MLTFENVLKLVYNMSLEVTEMRKVELRMNEQRKYELIKELVEHGGNKKRVALKLHITVRPLV